MKHTIPLGTRVSFTHPIGKVFEVDQYQAVLECPPNCRKDHDCFPEPYINVRRCEWTAIPLSTLKTIFDPVTHVGRPATDNDRKLVKD